MLGFFVRQLTFKPKPLSQDVRLDGKTAIVTGANVGLGLEASKEMARHGLARVVLGVRTVSKGEVAKQEILAQSPNCDVQVWPVDQESFESMAAFAERAQLLDRLDIVILCAGVKNLEFTLSKTGHEQNVQVGPPCTPGSDIIDESPIRSTTSEPLFCLFCSSSRSKIPLRRRVRFHASPLWPRRSTSGPNSTSERLRPFWLAWMKKMHSEAWNAITQASF